MARGDLFVRGKTTVPKDVRFVEAGAAAGWLWLGGLTYAKETMSDGFIPDAVLTSVSPAVKSPRKEAQRLVDAGLWHREAKGYRIDGFFNWNQSKDEIKNYQETDAERKRRVRGLSARTGDTGVQSDSVTGSARDSSRGGGRAPTRADSASDSASGVLGSGENPNGDGEAVNVGGAWRTTALAPSRSGGLIDGREVRRHSGHAWCSWPERDGLCVPAFLHAEFIGKLGRATADAELRAWYPRRLAEVAGLSVGEDALVFWRNSFAAWVGTVTAPPVVSATKGNASRDAMGRAVARILAEKAEVQP